MVTYFLPEYDAAALARQPGHLNHLACDRDNGLLQRPAPSRPGTPRSNHSAGARLIGLDEFLVVPAAVECVGDAAQATGAAASSAASASAYAFSGINIPDPTCGSARLAAAV